MLIAGLLDSVLIPTGSQREERASGMTRVGEPIHGARATPYFYKSAYQPTLCLINCSPPAYSVCWFHHLQQKTIPLVKVAKCWLFLICHAAIPKPSQRKPVLMSWLRFLMFSSHSLRWNAHFIKVMKSCCVFIYFVFAPLMNAKLAFPDLNTELKFKHLCSLPHWTRKVKLPENVDLINIMLLSRIIMLLM